MSLNHRPVRFSFHFPPPIKGCAHIVFICRTAPYHSNSSSLFLTHTLHLSYPFSYLLPPPIISTTSSSFHASVNPVSSVSFLFVCFNFQLAPGELYLLSYCFSLIFSKSQNTLFICGQITFNNSTLNLYKRIAQKDTRELVLVFAGRKFTVNNFRCYPTFRESA